jgi:hypothetical protein
MLQTYRTCKFRRRFFLDNGQICFLSLVCTTGNIYNIFTRQLKIFKKKCIFPCDVMHIPVSFMYTCYLPKTLRCSFTNGHLVTAGPKHQWVYKLANINVNSVFPHTMAYSGFGGLEVSCWPLVPKFSGSHPAKTVGILGSKKSSARLPSEGKSVPCRSFTACSLNVTFKTAFRQNYRTFLAHSSTFRRWVLSRGDMPGGESWNTDRTISLRLQCLVKKHNDGP